MDHLQRQAYLQAMGITPWVSRYAMPTEAAEPAAAPATERPDDLPVEVTEVAVAAPPVATPASSPAVASLLHEHEASHLPAWLLTRPLAALPGGSVLGPADAPLMLLEAPCNGASALCDGDSGKLLSRMLRAIGWSRRSVRNALLAPAGAESATDHPRSLAEYLPSNPPRAILVLAELPAHAPAVALDHLRVQLPALPEGPQLIVTHHPAYLLANPASKRAAWQDLQRLRDLLPAA